MERNTIQIQHINLECPIAEFGFNRFLLTFFIRYRVLNSNAFRPGIGPRPLRFTALFFDHVGVTKLLDFKSSCVIKNRRKASNIKVLKFIDQNSAARWVVSQTNVLQRNNTRAIFHNIFIDIVSTCVSSSRWPPEPSNQHLLLCSPAPAKHVTLSPFSFCSLIN